MAPALWGSLTSVCWGAADLMARYNGKRVGVAPALFVMMALSTVLLLVAELLLQGTPRWVADGWGVLLLGGALVLIATASLFAALVRGPISVAAPIASSYPLVNLAIAISRGATPSLGQWLAMAAVFGGVWLLARAAKDYEGGSQHAEPNVKITVGLALLAALTYGLAIEFTHQAQAQHGPIWAVIWVRVECLVLMGLYFLFVARRLPRVPWRLTPALLFQGMLDGGGYVFVLIGTALPGGEIAVVVTAGYAVVSSLLARLFLSEPVSLTQWLAIATVVGGVVYLAIG